MEVLRLRNYARLKEAVDRGSETGGEPPRGWEEVWRTRMLIEEGDVEPEAIDDAPESSLGLADVSRALE